MKYLNAKQKEVALHLGLMAGTADWIIKHLKLTGRDAGNIRTCQTLSRKVFQSIVDDLEPKAAKDFLRMVDRSEPAIYSDYDINVTKEKKQTEYLYDIAEYATSTVCKDCKLRDKAVDMCTLRIAMLNFNIPVFNTDPSLGECPYSVVLD